MTADSLDVAFCRHLLSLARAELKKTAPKIRVMRDAWVYHFHRDSWEFHGPDKFYWHGRAGNAYEARYKGWMAWLEKMNPTKPDLIRQAADELPADVKTL